MVQISFWFMVMILIYTGPKYYKEKHKILSSC